MQKEHLEGALGYEEGKKEKDNPYRKHSIKWYWWNMGYELCKTEYEKIKGRKQ